MLVVSQLTLMVLELPYCSIDADVKAGVEVLVAATGDEGFVMLDVRDDLDRVSGPGLVDDDLDLLDPIEVSGKLLDFL